MLTIGEAAPEIDANTYFPKDDKIERFRLEDMKGKWVILTFYPGDFTFVCATDIDAFMKKYADFEKNGALLLALSTDSVYSHKAWAQTSPRVKGSIIPLVEDFNKRISADYGFLNEDTGAARRGVVIIDPDSNVQYISIFNDSLGKDADHIYNAFMGLKIIYENPPNENQVCAIPANWRVGNDTLKIDKLKDIGKL